MRRLLSVLFTAAPFVVGMIAALSARRDLRLLSMAAVATLVVRLVFAPMAAKRGAANGAGAALAVASAAASVVAMLFGARAAFGIGAVAVVLAVCATAGAALGRRPGPPV